METDEKMKAKKVHTPVKHPHGVVERRQGKLLLGVVVHLGHDRVVRGKLDVLDEDRARIVEVRFALKDGLGIDGDSGPAVEGDGVNGGGHGDAFVLWTVTWGWLDEAVKR